MDVFKTQCLKYYQQNTNHAPELTYPCQSAAIVAQEANQG